MRVGSSADAAEFPPWEPDLDLPPTRFLPPPDLPREEKGLNMLSGVRFKVAFRVFVKNIESSSAKRVQIVKMGS